MKSAIGLQSFFGHNLTPPANNKAMKLKQKIKITEAKYVLDPTRALSSKFALSEELAHFFSVDKPAANMRIWYLDTIHQDLHNMDWAVRYRYHDGCDFELTYKKRFSEQAYNAAETDLIDTFLKEGFDPEMDLSQYKKTYSFSYVKHFPITDKLYDLTIPSAKRLAVVNTPSLYTDWNGKNEGLNTLLNTCLYGPVIAVEYKGEFRGIEISIEVWSLGTYLVEVSFDSATDACDAVFQDLLLKLNKKRLVIPQKGFKTEALFDYYSKNKHLITCE